MFVIQFWKECLKINRFRLICILIKPINLAGSNSHYYNCVQFNNNWFAIKQALIISNSRFSGNRKFLRRTASQSSIRFLVSCKVASLLRRCATIIRTMYLTNICNRITAKDYRRINFNCLI